MIDFRQIKMVSKLTLIIVAAFFLGLASCGKDNETSYDGWKYVGHISDKKGGNVSVYLDLNDMQIEGNIRKFWIRYYAKKDSVDNKEKYIRQIGYWEVDCQDRTLYRLGEEYYGSNSQLLGSTDERIQENYKKDSLGDKLAYAACRYAGKN
ncbi:MAG: hypothetical protein KAJ31_02455 [Deltaproteobacteria bacterium]|nr:hypothetical protein [Deltaproteobacteria bacterium]MCK5710479.1 hypothetical protein [Deltaproteobacteria bacterium]